MFERPQSQEAALSQALVLAITAPTDHQAQAANELAENLAVGLSEDEVENAKSLALEYLEMEEVS